MKEFEISLEDVEIISNDIEGWLVATDNGITVALDTTLTDDLIKEGIARELVSRIQNLRKDSGFDVTDRINISVQAVQDIQDAISTKKDYIISETLANALVFVSDLDAKYRIEFLDAEVFVKIVKV